MGTSQSGRRRRVRLVEYNLVYDSVRQCAQAIDGNAGAISDCLNGKRPSHKGYHFEDPDKEK